jgi:hypothetical protein
MQNEKRTSNTHDRADILELNEHNVAQLLLRIVRDRNRTELSFGVVNDPLMSLCIPLG